MLKEIRLFNFRGFNEHTLPLRERTVIVGANNTGKSTLVEAFRLIGLVTSRYRNLKYSKPPPDLGLPSRLRVVSPSLDSITINFVNMFHLLGDPPAVIEASFTEGQMVEIYLTGNKGFYAVIKDSRGRNVGNKSEANNITLSDVHILPQVAPLARDERILNEKYIRANLFTDLAPVHFRNQLRLLEPAYQKFVSLAAQTWPGLNILELAGKDGLPGDQLGLLVKDDQFVAEASWMGHGLQVWLQAMWFVARTPSKATAVLDEPDVYLHPDLQRRLIRLMHSKYNQFIIATHSTEIMAEVDPNEILVIDKKLKRSHFADRQRTVQGLIDHIGSAHNINLARLTVTKKFLIVEGDDIDIMVGLQKILYPNTDASLSTIPHISLGGWGGWDYAIGSKLTLQNYVGDKIIIYCLLDRDYHTAEQVQKRYEQAGLRDIELHIWSRKELENYLIVPTVIERIIKSRIDRRVKAPSIVEIEEKLDMITDELKQEVISGLGTEFQNDDRKGGFKTAHSRADEVVSTAWMTSETRLGIVSGKTVLSRLSQWAQEKYDVSFGPMTILKNMQREDIPAEIENIITAIEYVRTLNTFK